MIDSSELNNPPHSAPIPSFTVLPSPPRATTLDYALAFDTAAREALTGSVALDHSASDAQKIAFATTFADERGHRRLVDKPLLAWLLGLPLAELHPSPLREQDWDVAAWTALALAQAPSEEMLASDGPFVPLHDAAAIEVATELELAALHAFFNHAQLAAHPAALRVRIRQRTLRAATWLLENLQPDNATNHPWAAHVFALIAKDTTSPVQLEAALYAQALLHNSLIPRGKPDRFSALILLDAAQQLRIAEAAC